MYQYQWHSQPCLLSAVIFVPLFSQETEASTESKLTESGENKIEKEFQSRLVVLFAVS